MKYEVVNLKNQKTHGTFATFDEARGCVDYDGLTQWEIWEHNSVIVAYRDSGLPRQNLGLPKAPKLPIRCCLAKFQTVAEWQAHASPWCKPKRAAK